MKTRTMFVLAGALTLAAAGPAAAARPVAYAQPVEHAPAGPLAQIRGATVLPSGRLNTPEGTLFPLSGSIVATTIDLTGRRLLVTIRAASGASLLVLDTVTLRRVAWVDLPAPTVGSGLAVMRDPASAARQLVLVSTGTGGGVSLLDFEPKTSELRELQTLLLPADGAAHDTGMIATGIGRAYMTDELNGTVTTFDPRTGSFGAPVPVGLSPRALTRIGTALVVTNEGIARHVALTPAVPHYAAPIFDLDRATSANIIPLGTGGRLGSRAVPLDPTPQGAIIGGAHPTAVVGNAGLAYLSMSAVDRLAVMNLASGRVVGGTELRFFNRGPYGTQPGALALDAKSGRLYVALRGIDAVAVLDVAHGTSPHRLGLIPVVHAPSQVTLGAGGTALYVGGERGYGSGRAGVVERIDLQHEDLTAATKVALRNVRRIVPPPAAPAAIARVVHIRMPAATFDDVFGNHAPLDATAMPVLHRLAHRYVLATNIYSEAAGPLAAEELALAGEITSYTARTENAGGARRWEGTPPALGFDDAPRYGFLFDTLIRAGIPFRNYGALSALNRYDRASDPVYAAALQSGEAGACAVEFVHDHALYPRSRFFEIALPDRTDADALTAASQADAALGQIMRALQRDPAWPQTLVVISPWRPSSGGRDHVDASRIYAVIVDPHRTRPAQSRAHLSIESILKTEELVLGVEPVSLGDLLTSPLETLAGDWGSRGYSVPK